MNKIIHSKKISLSLMGLIILAVLVFVSLLLSTSPAAYASVEETSSSVRVFVGDVANAPSGYAISRSSYLTELSSSNVMQEYSAVVGMTDYLSIDEINDLMQEHDNITLERIYLWPEGETGRLSLVVENGNIPKTIYNFISTAREKSQYENDETFDNDLDRLANGEYGIFAITVSGTGSDLEELARDTEYCSYVDVMYNAEVEAYAASHGKTVSYIELPCKPDGAH